MKKLSLRRRKWILHIFALLLGATACYFAFRGVDLERMRVAVKAADWRLIALSALINAVVNTLARGLRFSTLLSSVEPGEKKPPFKDLLVMLLITRALNALLPARAGESVRSIRLHRHFGYSWESILAVLMVEPVVEVVSLGVPCFVIVLVGIVPESLRSQFQVIAMVAVGGISLALLYGWFRAGKIAVTSSNHRSVETRLRRAHARWAEAVRSLNSPRVLSRALLWSWLSDGADLLIVGLCLSAVSIHLGLAAWFVVLIAVNVAIVVPATPGAIGMLEAGAVLALKALGVEESQALAFALLYHAVHLVPVLLLGALAATGPLGSRDSDK